MSWKFAAETPPPVDGSRIVVMGNITEGYLDEAGLPMGGDCRPFCEVISWSDTANGWVTGPDNLDIRENDQWTVSLIWWCTAPDWNLERKESA